LRVSQGARGRHQRLLLARRPGSDLVGWTPTTKGLRSQDRWLPVAHRDLRFERVRQAPMSTVCQVQPVESEASIADFGAPNLAAFSDNREGLITHPAQPGSRSWSAEVRGTGQGRPGQTVRSSGQTSRIASRMGNKAPDPTRFNVCIAPRPAAVRPIESWVNSVTARATNRPHWRMRPLPRSAIRVRFVRISRPGGRVVIDRARFLEHTAQT